MDICIVCGKEIKDVYMYDSHELFCSDDCKEVNKEDEIENEYPYNVEFGDGRTKEEMDKIQDEIVDKERTKVCPGCNGVFVLHDDTKYGGCCSPECNRYMMETFG